MSHLILVMAVTKSCLLPYVFRLNSLCGLLEKVTTPICTFRGPMSKAWAKRETKSNCFWKLDEPTEPEESNKNTISAGFEPQAAKKGITSRKMILL